MTFGGQLFAGKCRAIACVFALAIAPLCLGGEVYAAAPVAAPPPSAPSQVTSTAPRGLVQHIVIDGAQRIEAATVISYMLVHEGDVYDDAAADGSLKALFATGLFADVRLNWDGSTLTVHVVENPIINQVAFEGNSKMSEKDLTKEVQIKPRTIFTRAKVQADVQRIIELYRRDGRFAATVDPKIIQRPQNRVDLIFEINEGASTGISRINFIGNKVFDDDTLKDQIVTTETAWWKFLATNDNYDPDRLTFDREQLRRFYLQHGYADFRVISAVAELTPARDAFFITFTVDEGQQYKFGKVVVDSQIKDLKPQDLMPLMKAQQGETYNAELLDKTVEALTFAAGTKGFVFVDIHPRVTRNAAARTIDVTFRIEPGPRVYVEKINIIGNTRTLDKVIRREFRLAEGDAFNRVLVDRSRTRIRALGFFKDVDIKEEPGSAPDRTVLNVTVKEQPTGELSFGAGYSTQASFLLQLSYTESNLFGRGQFMRASASYSAIQQQYNFSFTDPYFMDRPLAAGFQAYRTQTDFTQGHYFSDSTLFGLLVGFPLSEYGRITPHYNFKLDNVVADPGAPLEIQLSAGKAATSLIGYSYAYDTRDDPIKPTHGMVFVLNQDLAGFGGTRKYLKNEGSAAYYHPIIWDDLIGSVTLSAGYINAFDRQNVFITDRFFKGADSFPGFAIAGVGPRDTSGCIRPGPGTTCATPGHQTAALGGQAYAISAFEVRLPSVLPEDYGIGLSLFTDLGTVGIVPGSSACTAQSCIHDEMALRGSAGLIFRWKSPFGPIQIDMGYPFLKQSYDKVQAITFSAGTTF